jgi:hypothetical protein
MDSLKFISDHGVPVLVADSTITLRDRIGHWKARWNIRRMNLRVTPGLYALGEPSAQSPVFASANYKMSFDLLRMNLKGTAAWILVLDTKGVNVWCAAGKGAFGTENLVRRIRESQLDKFVTHGKIILPQLSAPGVAAHAVKKASGFSVVYGPVRASDLPAFLATGNAATPEMRRVNFTFADRLVLVPVEFVSALLYALPLMVVAVILAGITRQGYFPAVALLRGVPAALCIAAAVFAGAVVAPLCLPLLPGRAFSVKGFFAGLLAVAGLYAWNKQLGPAWFFIVPAIASFLAMNFTGASTYTSLSGVRKEMRIALPAQIAGVVVGGVCGIMELLTR